jgi:hypothetical protein
MPATLHRLILVGIMVTIGLILLIAVLASDMVPGAKIVGAIGIIYGYILWFDKDRPLEDDCF